jgi:ABC-type Fe3+ transport system permease subunit
MTSGLLLLLLLLLLTVMHTAGDHQPEQGQRGLKRSMGQAQLCVAPTLLLTCCCCCCCCLLLLFSCVQVITNLSRARED